MCRLFETIRIENGVPVNLEYHQRRVDRSRHELFGLDDRLDLSSHMPAPPAATGIFKWRVIYDRQFQETTIEPYLPKKVRSLQMVRNDQALYPFKYFDRTGINEMFALRGACDDILVVRNGLVTDTSYANLVFLFGKSWITPRNPMLPGTCRERLLETGVICEAEIAETDLHLFKSASLINAMLEPGEVVIKIRDIIPVPWNR
jgi:4-amino-4-deoxychorismate lyase